MYKRIEIFDGLHWRGPYHPRPTIAEAQRVWDAFYAATEVWNANYYNDQEDILPLPRYGKREEIMKAGAVYAWTDRGYDEFGALTVDALAETIGPENVRVVSIEGQVVYEDAYQVALITKSAAFLATTELEY